MTAEQLVGPLGPLELTPRNPGVRGARAWDAADELLLAALHGAAPAAVAEDLAASPALVARHDRHVVVAEERHGALCASLAPPPAGVVVDSWSSERAARRNLERNGGDPSAMWWRSPLDAAPTRVELVVLRPGRDLGSLRLLLDALAPRLTPDAVLVGGAMARHLRRSTLEVVASSFGPVRTTRAHRRARLFVATRDDAGDAATPGEFRHGGLTVVGWPGVFGARRVDPGTRRLIESLDDDLRADAALDLCCGTGILAVTLASRRPGLEVLAVDDSAVATDAARRTVTANGLSGRVQVVQGDVLDLRVGEVPPASMDLVVCNPPFHEDRAVSDDVAWRCMVASRRVLRRGGELRLVANRSLGHHTRLRRVFGNCELVSSDHRFVVLSSRRS